MADDRKIVQAVNVWSLAGEIGLLLSLPLVILVPLAVKLDRTFHTLPLFIIGSLILSIVISTLAVARKVRRIKLL
ncbi:MAG: hypothetical protein AAB538_01350 [Patescibacteria group bacterium]